MLFWQHICGVECLACLGQSPAGSGELFGRQPFDNGGLGWSVLCDRSENFASCIHTAVTLVALAPGELGATVYGKSRSTALWDLFPARLCRMGGHVIYNPSPMGLFPNSCRNCPLTSTMVQVLFSGYEHD